MSAKIPVIDIEYQPQRKEFYQQPNRTKMENILMRFCRESQKYPPKAVATHLGINVSEYREIEAGKILLSKRQSRQLSKLFNVKGDYLYEAALQLDLLLAKNEMVTIQKEKIEELKRQLHQLQN